MALSVMCFSWVQPITDANLEEEKTNRKRFYKRITVMQYNTTSCVVKAIFIPYIVKFYYCFGR